MQNLPPKPLPLNFYNKKGWLQTILDYYGGKPQYLPKPLLQKPMAALTKEVGNIIDIYGNFPESTYKALRQSVNPMYQQNEYYRRVYEEVRSVTVNTSEKEWELLAKSLLFIRRLYEMDEAFYRQYFEKEIAAVPVRFEDDKIRIYMERIREIVKNHVTQVSRLIKQG